MGRAVWENIKYSKTFYVRTYRRASTVLLVSICINVLLGGLIYYAYISQPERDFYASSGIIPPVKLTAMATRNYSSKALLKPDPVNDNETKVIPQ